MTAREVRLEGNDALTDVEVALLRESRDMPDAIAALQAIVTDRVAQAAAERDEVIDAIEETFLAHLPSKAISYCAQEDVNAGLDAMRERFQTAEWRAGERP